jgi:hypothetical protein
LEANVVTTFLSPPLLDEVFAGIAVGQVPFRRNRRQVTGNTGQGPEKTE